jgi:hypothetical protein
MLCTSEKGKKLLQKEKKALTRRRCVKKCVFFGARIKNLH